MTYPVDKPKKDRTEKDRQEGRRSPSLSRTAATAGRRRRNDGRGAGQARHGGRLGGVRIGGRRRAGGGGIGSATATRSASPISPTSTTSRSSRTASPRAGSRSLVDPGVAGTFYTTVYFKILRNGQIAELDGQGIERHRSRWTCRPSGPSRSPPRSRPSPTTTTGTTSASISSSSIPNEQNALIRLVVSLTALAVAGRPRRRSRRRPAGGRPDHPRGHAHDPHRPAGLPRPRRLARGQGRGRRRSARSSRPT